VITKSDVEESVSSVERAPRKVNRSARWLAEDEKREGGLKEEVVELARVSESLLVVSVSNRETTPPPKKSALLLPSLCRRSIFLLTNRK